MFSWRLLYTNPTVRPAFLRQMGPRAAECREVPTADLQASKAQPKVPYPLSRQTCFDLSQVSGNHFDAETREAQH